MKTLIGLWAVWVVIWVISISACLFVAFHFISKFW